MKIIKLPYSIPHSNSAPMGVAIKLSQWLREEYDLVKDRDYDWCFMSKNKEFHLRFFGDREKDFESMETFLILKWQTEFVQE
jgi:hypothetical protein